MSNHRTLHVLSISHGRAIRRSRSEEHLPSSYKAEEDLNIRRNSVTIRTIPSFCPVGKLTVQYISKEQREARKSIEEFSGNQEKQIRRRNRSEGDLQLTEKGQTDSLDTIAGSQPWLKITMSLVPAASPLTTVHGLEEARDTIKKLNDSLLKEKRLSETKDMTIENLRHEINLLDQELVDKRKENDKHNEEMRKLRSKTTALETENKILERQVKMMNESNKRLHNELHELRNKLRIQETKVGELRVQRSEAVRKYAHLLQTSVDKGTRLRYFLQQLQNEILAHSVTSKKFHVQKQVLEDLMKEDSKEDLQFKKYGLISPQKMRRGSYLLSEEEKQILRKDLEVALGSKNNKRPDKSIPIEKLTTATERIVTEGLKSRLGKDNEETSQMSKLIEEAKYQIKGLDRIESSHVETSKRLEDKVGTQLKVLEGELKDLSNELKLAQISKREDEEKLRSIRKFSVADKKVDSIILARRTSQIEKLELESVINSMERRMSEDTSTPMSPREAEMLSMKHKMAEVLEDKLMLSDELIESRTSLSNLENLLESRGLENKKMEQELEEKEQRISVVQEHLREASIETYNLKEELEATKQELTARRREEIAQPELKAKDRPHRVELNFTPTSQPALEQKAWNVKKESSRVRSNSPSPEPSTESSPLKREDEEVKVDNKPPSPRPLQRIRSEEDLRRRTLRRTLSLDPKGWESSLQGLERRRSLDPTDFRTKQERKVTTTKLKLVRRADKAIQVESSEQLTKAPENFKDFERTREALNRDNQELRVILGKQDEEIASLVNELGKIRGGTKDSAESGENSMPFNYPKRVSELWTSLEGARKEKEEGEKRNKELQDELERQQQEIQAIIRNLKRENPQLPFEARDSFEASLQTERKNYFEKGNPDSQQSRSLQEFVSANETKNMKHEFVFDNEDGRRIPNELQLEVSSWEGDTISTLESFINLMKKDLATSLQQSKELETELYRKEEDLRKARKEIALHEGKPPELTARSDERVNGEDRAAKEVITLQTKVAELTALLEETKKEKLKTEEKCERFTSQISELNAAFGQIREENAHFVKNIEQYKSQINDLQISLEDSKTHLLRAEKEIQGFKSKIIDLQISLDEIKAEKDEANEIIERSISKIPELTALLDNANEELSTAKREIELYQTENLELKSHLENTEHENRSSLDEIAQYKSQILILESSLEKIRKENASLREEVRQDKSEILDFKASLEVKRKENEWAIEEIERYKSRSETFRESLDNVKKENNDNLKEIDDYKQQISDLKTSLGRSKKESTNVTKEYELYKFEISDLQTCLDAERKENRAAAEKIDKHQSEISSLKDSLDKANKEVNAKHCENERYKSQISDLQASLETEREENLAARRHIVENESEICDLNSTLQQAKKDKETMVKDNQRCKFQISDLQVILEDVRKENLASAEKITRYESELFDLKNSFEKAKEKTSPNDDEIESYKTQISDLQATIEDARSNKERCQNELQNEIKKCDEKEQEHKMKEAETRLEMERLKTSNSKLQITINNLKAQLMEADKKMKALEDQVEEDNKTIAQLMEEQLGVSRLQEQVKVLETKLGVRDKNLEHKVEEIIEKNKLIEHLQVEKDKLERSFADDSLKRLEDPLYFDSVDGEIISETAAAQSLSQSPPVDGTNVEDIEEIGNEVVEVKEQLQTLQVALDEIQKEKGYLEETVRRLQNEKINQEKELELLKRQVQILEDSVKDTEKTLEKNAQKMLEKENELHELINEKVVKTSQIESLKASLTAALRERDSVLTGKRVFIDDLPVMSYQN